MNDLWFFTPLLPSPTGNGSAMRASVALEVLSERFNVFVIHPELWGHRLEGMRADWVREHTAGYFSIPVPLVPAEIERTLKSALAISAPQAIYTFRMSAAPVAVRAMAMLGNRALPSVLDLDDNENIRAERMAELHKNYGNTELAAHELRELPNLRRFQKLMLPRFSVSLLAGSGDRDIFAAEHPSIRFVRLPNVVRLPPPVRNQSSEPFSLLFLGTLCYLPNEDALSLFCDSIVPKILERKPHVNLRVAGTNATARVRALANREGVTFVGTVPDVSTEYERCGAVVVPLRGGSGTRIKILEAFSYRRPVVSTSLGAEGLGTVHGEHLLIADTPEEFAAACLRLLEDGDLRGRLVENAYQWLLATHSIDRAREVLHSLYPAVG